MEESIFYKRVRKLATDLGKSFNQIEKELGYSRNALSNYKNVTLITCTLYYTFFYFFCQHVLYIC